MKQILPRPAGRPTAAEIESIEQALLTTAFAEFVEHGYAGASLTRVAQRARMSKTTLYSRYPSKDALFRDVLRRRIDQNKPYRSLYSVTGPLDIAEGLKRFAIDMLSASLEPDMRALNAIILGEVGRFPELAKTADDKLQQGIDRIARFLDDATRCNGRAIEDPRSVAEAYIHMIRGWYLNRLISGQPTSKGRIYQWVRSAVRAFIRSGPEW